MANTSRILFHLPGNGVIIETDYLVAEALATALPMYAVINPGTRLTVSIGPQVRHVLPINTAFTMTHAVLPDEASDSETLALSEKISGLLNEGLHLVFSEDGSLLG